MRVTRGSALLSNSVDSAEDDASVRSHDCPHSRSNDGITVERTVAAVVVDTACVLSDNCVDQSETHCCSEWMAI